MITPNPRGAAVGARTAVVMAALLLAAPAGAADCASAYANHEADWAITREQWNADCASGLKPNDILRTRQQTFMNECAAHYRPFLAKARLEDWNLQVYCAQGAAGEAKLSSMAGAPLRRPPPAAKDAPAALPLTEARRYYNSVDTLGSELPKNWHAFPGGIVNNPQLRAFLGISHDMYVNLAANPALCVMSVNTVLQVGGRCGPDEPYIRRIVDKGCTGRIATMSVTGPSGEALNCSQKKIDEIYAALDAAYTAGRPKAGK